MPVTAITTTKRDRHKKSVKCKKCNYLDILYLEIEKNEYNALVQSKFSAFLHSLKIVLTYSMLF